MQPMIFAPASGWTEPYFSLNFIKAGISDSASVISLLPNSAKEISATL